MIMSIENVCIRHCIVPNLSGIRTSSLTYSAKPGWGEEQFVPKLIGYYKIYVFVWFNNF